jgi:hypothetical protein
MKVLKYDRIRVQTVQVDLSCQNTLQRYRRVWSTGILFHLYFHFISLSPYPFSFHPYPCIYISLSHTDFSQSFLSHRLRVSLPIFVHLSYLFLAVIVAITSPIYRTRSYISMDQCEIVDAQLRGNCRSIFSWCGLRPRTSPVHCPSPLRCPQTDTVLFYSTLPS